MPLTRYNMPVLIYIFYKPTVSETNVLNPCVGIVITCPFKEFILDITLTTVCLMFISIFASMKKDIAISYIVI